MSATNQYPEHVPPGLLQLRDLTSHLEVALRGRGSGGEAVEDGVEGGTGAHGGGSQAVIEAVIAARVGLGAADNAEGAHMWGLCTHRSMAAAGQREKPERRRLRTDRVGPLYGVQERERERTKGRDTQT